MLVTDMYKHKVLVTFFFSYFIWNQRDFFQNLVRVNLKQLEYLKKTAAYTGKHLQSNSSLQKFFNKIGVLKLLTL